MTANVAAALAQLKILVTVIDLDPQNTLRLHFGVPLQDSAGFGPGLAWSAQPPWQTFLRQTPWGIRLLPFGQIDAEGALTVFNALTAAPDRLGAVLEPLLADPKSVVLIDSPPGPSAAMTAALPYVDMLICVLLADAISTALIPSIEAGRAFGTGTEVSKEAGRVRYVLNQFDGHSRLSRATAEAVRPYLGPRLLGEVRWDETVAEAAANQCPVPFFAPASHSATDFARIAQEIVLAFGLSPQEDKTV